MAGRFFTPRSTGLDSNGDPLSGAKLYFYETGTTTPLDTYSDDDLTSANANPVVADSAGRFGEIFLKDQDYKVVLKTSADVTIWTADPVRAAEPTSTAVISKTTTYVVTLSDKGKLILADATSSGFTVTLPTAASAGDGFEIGVKKTDTSSNAVTVDADGSETIDGDTDVSLPNQNDAVWMRSNGTAWYIITQPLTSDRIPFPRGYIDGLVMSNNGTDADHDIDIAAGAARDGANGANMVLSAAITKRIDAAWAVGDGNGGIDTGSVTTATWYHVWLIKRSDTGVVDALFSTSASAPTMPASYDIKRRIGAVLTDGSSNILAFKQRTGGHFEWVTPVLDVNDATPTSTDGGEEYTLSVPPSTRAKINALVNDNAAIAGIYVAPTDVTDDAPGAALTGLPLATSGISATGASDVTIASFAEVWVNSSSIVNASVNSGDATIQIVTLGWWDARGQDA